MNKQTVFKLVSEIFSIITIAIVVLASFYFYNHFPEKVPTHWNIKGEIDGWSSPAVAAFLIPIVLFFLYIMFLVLPKIDPQKERYIQFNKPYKIFQNVIIIFMAILYFLTGFSGLGYKISIDNIVPIMVGILFMIIGNYMGKIKKNWFVGIKTPWTLSSENIWNKTHRLGGKLFVLGGFLMMLMPFFIVYVKIYLFIFIIIILAVIPAMYSYFEYKKEENNKER